MDRPSRQHARRGGFTLMEMTLVGGLMSLLVVLIAASWTALGRPSYDAAIRGRMTLEANLAAESLVRDLGGGLVGDASGKLPEGRLVGRTIVLGTQLLLCYDGSPANGLADWVAPDKVIAYDLQSGQLIRTDQTASTQFAVAELVSNLTFTDLGGALQVDITFDYRDLTRVYTFEAKDP